MQFLFLCQWKLSLYPTELFLDSIHVGEGGGGTPQNVIKLKSPQLCLRLYQQITFSVCL